MHPAYPSSNRGDDVLQVGGNGTRRSGAASLSDRDRLRRAASIVSVDSLASAFSGLSVATVRSTQDLCTVCRKEPLYQRNGRTYSTCGVVCASRLPPGYTNIARPNLPAPLRARDFVGLQSLPCIICKARPRFEDRFTCGLTCAEKLGTVGGDPTKCTYCHTSPRRRASTHCSARCEAEARNACLYCKYRPRNGRYHLCGRTCQKLSAKRSPMLLEVPQGHNTFQMVESNFLRAWKAKPTHQARPTIKRVFKIVQSDESRKVYDAYSRKKNRSEQYRYHGTRRTCFFGNEQTPKVCNHHACALCNILKSSFKVECARATGAFGAGIYTSSASNKSYSYTSGTAGGVMLLNKVVLGKVKTVQAFNEVMECPRGYDSVVFDRMNGVLNETVVYSEEAIRPVFLIVF